MIERKRGHIVGISSIAGKTTFPCAIAYCSTKHGVTGFMNALYDELCAFDDDEYVKCTTVFPNFINTRKELGDILDKLVEFIPRMTPEYVAEEVVKAMLTNKREINLPYGSQFATCMK
jgi:short-subunit dehydrogenase